jgi:glutamate dehydrogenase/leucine dehydrogenase
VVGIIDRNGGLINTDGFSFEEITALFTGRSGNQLVAENMLSFDEINENIWDVEAEIFIPAAASRLITKEQVDRLLKSGIEVVSCGANVPFADSEIFFGPIGEYADNQLSVLPDFIANCGMARVFAYLMQNDADLSDKAIFGDTSEVIGKAVQRCYDASSNKKHIAKTAFEIALKQLI